jgi:hypothetical protein
MYKNNLNVSEVTRTLDWDVNKREYHHLLVLLEYMPLKAALGLMFKSEVER